MSADSDCSDIDRENCEVVERVVKVNDDSHIRIRKTRSDKGVKKERTPAQKEATAKALAILKERREAKKKEDEERMSKATEQERQRVLAEKYEKQKQHKAKLPPAPSYVTLADMEAMKKEILSALPKEVYKAVEVERKVVKEKPVEKPVVVEKPVEKAVVKPVEKPVAAKLTGHELLDKLFFTK